MSVVVRTERTLNLLAELPALVEHGYDGRQIATMMGVSRQVITYTLKILGLRTKNLKIRIGDKRRACILVMINEGATRKDIVAALDSTRSQFTNDCMTLLRADKITKETHARYVATPRTFANRPKKVVKSDETETGLWNIALRPINERVYK